MNRLFGAALLTSAVAGVTLAARAGFEQLVRRGLPQTYGVVTLPYVGSDVEIVRDRWGVPHIFAASDDDLFFAQGFVHAQDRAFQLELNRRVVRGRLSEIFGPATLAIDRFFRYVNLLDVAEKEVLLLDAETNRVLQAYCRGVNAAFEHHAGGWPIEFTVLRIAPEPWTPLDCVLWTKLMAFSLSPNYDTELLRAQIVARVGPELAALLEPGYPQDALVSAPPGARCGGSFDLAAAYRQIVTLPAGGSNAWAVDGSRSASGQPLLASDPHLPPQSPSIWTTVHLHGERYCMAGAGMAGVPPVVHGHNGRIAWGVTAAQGDVTDLYEEQFHPHDRRRYRYRGEWLEASVRVEAIAVRGRRDLLREEVLETIHGPVISPVLGTDLPPLALRSAVLEPSRTITAGLRLNCAQNWDEFRSALRHFAAPELNFLYADVDGNVGYQLAGRFPIRARGHGVTPAPGWTGEHEWTGWVPFDQLPNAYNPPSHQVVNGNNQPAPEDYPHFLGFEFTDRFRAERIWSLLEVDDRHTPESFASIQVDVYSAAAVALVRCYDKIEPVGDLASYALGMLRTWDGHVRADSAPAAIYELLRLQLLRNIVSPILGDLTERYLGRGVSALAPWNTYVYRQTSWLLAQIRQADPHWRPNAYTDWPALLERSLTEVVDELRRQLGPDPAEWRWGKLHQVVFRHPFGRIGLFGRYFNVGPAPIDGDAETVLQTNRNPIDGWLATGSVPSFRLIVDLADFDNSLAVNTTGESGHPASPHYADQFDLWRTGRHHPLPWTRARVREVAEDVLILRRTNT